MADRDEWGQDPAVKGMRRVFKEMESRQKNLLTQLNLSFYDSRLRRWREQALFLFNNAWTRADRLGVSMDAGKAGSVYVAGLSKILQMDGIELPEALLSFDADIEMLLREEDA
jgi:hypothetical protein